MKRILKRILPILLGLVIICSILWYLFIYDRGFMQDILLGSARFFEKHGNHNIASKLYNEAYLRSDGSDDVIIELAERFKKIGSYTKAEVALSNAIAENPSADLYIALSKTYVEQDKLMDAVKMLDNITDPAIKEQLDAMRPKAPVATPAPGYYRQYMNVSIEAADGATIYVATDGDFPSIENVLSDDIKLVGGENKIYVIAVDQNGLVSTPCYFSYIVGGVIEEVVVSDPVLDGLFRELLNKTPDDKIYTDDLWTITSLTVPADIEDYSDLSLLIYLESLVMENVKFDNLQMLSSLTQLKELKIHGCPISATDLSIIGTLPSLENLTLTDCSLTNISGLSTAKHLQNLNLSNNAIKDLSALSFLDKLTTLDLNNNALTDLSALSTLNNITTLDVSYNSLTSVLPLATCSRLTTLSATNNQLSEIPLFDNPAVLVNLNLSNNNLTNISALSKYTSLESLKLARNQLTDVSALSGLKTLVNVDISYNQIKTLPSWSKDSALVDLNGANNKITSVSPLRGLTQLNHVNLDNNKITNVNPLAECPMLVRVSVYGNSVKDVSKLTSQNVVVNYKPV